MEIDTGDFAVTRIGENQEKLTRSFIEGNQHIHVSYIEGLCMADSDNPSRLRDREFYLENVLGPLIASGKVSDGSSGPYDDRKLRFDAKGTKYFFESDPSSPHSGSLSLAFGITHFAEHKKAMERTPQENNALRRKGLEDFEDQYAYFPRAPGVSGLVLSSEGSLFLGTREYRGKMMLQGVAGHLPYVENVKDISLEKGLLDETKQEFGVFPEDIKRTVFVGAYEEPHSGDIDFTHLTFTNLDDRQVAEAWRTKRKDKEHKELIRIPSYAEVQALLKDGSIDYAQYGLFSPTRGALMSLRQGEMSD